MYDKRLERKGLTPVTFTENNPETTEVNHAWPVHAIMCHLTGTLTIATAAATALNDGGCLGLISSLRLIRNGSDVLFNLPGRFLKRFSDLYCQSPQLQTDPLLTTAAHAFEAYFMLPINAGPGPFSLLDPSRISDLTLEVNWGDAEDIVTPDTGTVLTLSSVQLNADVVQWAGGKVGEAGGPQFKYPDHYVNYQDVAVTAANSEQVIELLRRQLYHRLVMFADSDAALVDTVLNNAQVRIDENVLMDVSDDMLQAENLSRYNLGSSVTGQFVLDFAPGPSPMVPRLDHMLAVKNPAIPFNLVVDVAHPGTTDKLIVVSDRFARPVAA